MYLSLSTVISESGQTFRPVAETQTCHSIEASLCSSNLFFVYWCFSWIDLDVAGQYHLYIKLCSLKLCLAKTILCYTRIFFKLRRKELSDPSRTSEWKRDSTEHSKIQKKSISSTCMQLALVTCHVPRRILVVLIETGIEYDMALMARVKSSLPKPVSKPDPELSKPCASPHNFYRKGPSCQSYRWIELYT